jgi:hypothetical protein
MHNLRYEGWGNVKRGLDDDEMEMEESVDGTLGLVVAVKSGDDEDGGDW